MSDSTWINSYSVIHLHGKKVVKSTNIFVKHKAKLLHKLKNSYTKVSGMNFFMWSSKSKFQPTLGNICYHLKQLNKLKPDIRFGYAARIIWREISTGTGKTSLYCKDANKCWNTGVTRTSRLLRRDINTPSHFKCKRCSYSVSMRPNFSLNKRNSN